MLPRVQPGLSGVLYFFALHSFEFSVFWHATLETSLQNPELGVVILGPSREALGSS